jgi:hypothetical protein
MTNEKNKVLISMRVGNELFEMSINISQKDIPSISRAFQDAIDIAMCIDEMVSKDITTEQHLQFDMTEFKKFSRSKTEEERNTSVMFLENLLKKKGYENASVGFPVDENDDILNDEILYINIKRK